MKGILKSILIGTLALVNGAGVNGQNIILDKPTSAGELTLFPDMEDEKSYYYLPDKPRLATGKNGKPQFSFLRYVDNSSSGDEGEGGGIVHAVVVLEVTEDQRREAERELQSVAPGAKIVGPVVYRDGNIALVSSIAQEDGEFAKKVIGLGKAPILDGQKAAISVLLNKQGAKILHASFQTPTPDMSVSFEMVVSGYRMPKKAVITAEWDKVYEHKSFQAAVASPILQAEVDMAFEDLVQSGAIKIVNKGADEQMESIIKDVQEKLTRMMLEPISGTGTPGLSQLASSGSQNSILDRATNLLNASRTDARNYNKQVRSDNRMLASAEENRARTAASEDSNSNQRQQNRGFLASYFNALPVSRNETPGGGAGTVPREEIDVPGVAIAASFKMRKIRQKGTYRVDLEKWSTDNMTLRFDENFGEINCDECFIDVNLDDPLYKQRELVVSLDGMNAGDFGDYINFVNVTPKKEHQNGDVTTEEVKIDRQNFNQQGNLFSMMYGWKGDNDRRKWADYQYKTVWNFFGGGAVEFDWQNSDIQVIPVSAPYLRREILIDTSPDVLLDYEVRGIEIKLYYTVGDQRLNKLVRLNPRNEEYSATVDIIAPRENTEYQYEITWYLNDGTTHTSGLQDANSTMLFADNIITD